MLHRLTSHHLTSHRVTTRRDRAVVAAVAVVLLLVVAGLVGAQHGSPAPRRSGAASQVSSTAQGSSGASAGAADGSRAGRTTRYAPAAPVPADALQALPRAAASAPAEHSASGTAAASSPPAADATQHTRIVRTGSVSLQVRKGQVDAAVSRLAALARTEGGYVDSSHVQADGDTPSGEVVLRVPTARFDETVAAARRLGTVTSVSTSADDVTGHYVDLAARAGALRRTRSTYLTILSHASSIGDTLSVQQRVDDVQQRLESLQGQLKLLRGQTSDATLSLDVTQAGDPLPGPTTPRARSGLGAAFHRSVQRFDGGIFAVVAGLGPVLLVLLLLLLAVAIGRIGYAVGRRLLSSGYAAVPAGSEAPRP